MEDNFTNFKNFIYLKDQLLKADYQVLREMYEDYENYIAFVVAVVDILNNEPLFFLLNEDMIDEVENILSIHRFTKNDSDLKETINQIVIFFNQLIANNEEEKDLLYYDFVVNQEDMRRVIFKDENTLVQALSYDADVLEAIEDNNFTFLDKDPFTLMSINYLMSRCSNLFQDERISNNTIDQLNNISDRNNHFGGRVKAYSKDLKRTVQKIKKKNE